MKGIQSFCALLIFSFLMTSCGDDGGLTLTLTSPNNDTVFTGGDVISITGTATDDVEVTSLIFESQEITFSDTVDGNGTGTVPFTYDLGIAVGTTANDNVTIKVTAIDGEGNSVSEERTISIQ